ncbi:hypothetical protein [Arthrobacter sp. 260]|uniref:hypothetical protein n=1 Tax=Arthrobacter sp. 260 TaxID=2735314 RepID=UPI0014911458|nr:hypothetical protein [Arthrobacter sp. 260]NOJ60759.1 hypothetical protein [Arthrobacter sp. 260]
MNNPLDVDSPEEDGPRSTTRTVVAGVLVCSLALALGIGYLISSQSPNMVDAGSTPTAPASVAAERPDDSGSPTQTGPTGGTSETESEGPPAGAPGETATAAPAESGATPGSGSTPTGEGVSGEPGQSDAELATVEQPVSEPVALGEPAVVTAGLTAAVSAMEAIEAEAFGIGEIAGPALRFVVTVENTSDEAVSLSNSVVNVEYGPESLPAVQLTGSGATEFPASVDAGASVSTTLVFSIPADQRDQIRILLNVEASSPIAAFVGAAPGEEG